ncbi:uracil-DNA glycosylase [Sphingomonas ginkgonis]|uniref:Uracil-DNA glycosylase n=1 Tax=Sphingomonas ginkgonis TaxID=2315330 RepID=A0A429VAR1_9SPHN|nr:uracil-DNA glycosylase [Sphingomonas ginkgonis]RST31038.1 uracil-DNA glycosylase [Sphingomonas ginkgonis]
MGGEGLTLSRDEAASLLGWWLEAGVDCLVDEAPRQWLKAPARVPATNVEQPTPARPALASPPPPAATDPLPPTLEAFHAWIGATEDLPLASPGARRALPHGPAQAEIMIVADAPDDGDESRPVTGDSFALMTRMLKAIGVSAEDAYVAALSCYPLVGRKLDTGAAARCRDLILHQVELVGPKRLILFGDGPARALTGAPVAQARGKIHRIKGVQAVVTFHPRWLLKRPADKARAWADLLLLMGEPT